MYNASLKKLFIPFSLYDIEADDTLQFSFIINIEFVLILFEILISLQRN